MSHQAVSRVEEKVQPRLCHSLNFGKESRRGDKGEIWSTLTKWEFGKGVSVSVHESKKDRGRVLCGTADRRAKYSLLNHRKGYRLMLRRLSTQ